MQYDSNDDKVLDYAEFEAMVRKEHEGHTHEHDEHDHGHHEGHEE